MRESFSSEALENGSEAKIADESDPPPLDRARIDSEVQALLRQPSTPWIVFDRDTQADFAKSALRVGAVFVSSPSFRPEVLKAAEETGRPLEDVVDKPLPGLAPLSTAVAVSAYAAPTAIITPPSAPRLFESDSPFPDTRAANGYSEPVEPSNVVVASDITDDSQSNHTARNLAVAISMLPPAPKKKASRGVLAAVACAGMLGVLVTAGVVVRAPALSGVKAVAAASTVSDEVPATVVQAPTQPAATDLAVAPVIEIPDTTTAAVDAKPEASKLRFGRLTVSSHAKHKNVYLDGKRMLGNGRRSFLVACGKHSVAVSDKAAAKDVEVPCDGELVVGR